MKPVITLFHSPLSAAECFERLSGGDQAFFLDSGMDPRRLGRYSFTGSHPFLVMKSRGRAVRLSGADGTSRVRYGQPG